MEGKLTSKQKKFCQNFVSGVETCGNGVKAYADAYGYDLSNQSKYQSAKSNANRLLNTSEVNAYIEELLEAQRLTPHAVDNQLDFLIRQNGNLAVKLQAINTYYKFRKKIEDKPKESILSKRAAEMARTYMDKEDWDKEYSHYFSPAELEKIDIAK